MRRITPKKELSPKGLENLKARLWQVPHLDRTSLLALSVIDDSHEAYAASAGLIALSAHMAQSYSVENKLRLAEFLRTTADVLDHAIAEKITYDVASRD
jgi:hypothetical protein